jgi:CRISPR-associated protein Cmr2
MKHLLSVSIGPVQEFIAAARKTSDLQAGSSLLVETARRVAKTLEQQGKLIFPCSADADSIPNKILIELCEGVEPELAAQGAKQAAQAFLKEQWERTKRDVPEGCLDQELADEQIERFLEFYAAWVPMNGCYVEERKLVERLLAGRKALRDFEQPLSRAGRPKSPLDPSRDCVLTGGRDRELSVPVSCQRPPLSLKPRETLDAISLLKRERGADIRSKVPFSTSMMAARAYLLHTPEDLLLPLKNLAEDLGQGNDFSDLLYPERTADLLEELEKSDGEVETYQARAKEARKAVLNHLRKSEFPAYYAVLAADGDRMGKLLSDMKDSQEHRDFSGKLAEFAKEARHVIVGDFHGHCVYTGGDDILALLPVTQALDCARRLASLFNEKIGATLSVGVAIVHHLENLQVSVERARAAEREAKKQRNSLAVAQHTRGGAPVLVAEKWCDEVFREWNDWIRAFSEPPKTEGASRKKGLSRGFPYELLALAREWTEGLDQDLLYREAKRILHKKEGSQKPELPERLKAKGRAEWEMFARKLVIARFIAGLTPGGGES